MDEDLHEYPDVGIPDGWYRIPRTDPFAMVIYGMESVGLEKDVMKDL